MMTSRNEKTLTVLNGGAAAGLTRTRHVGLP
jgi:hypothetical protein